MRWAFERPELRHLMLFVPPDVAVRAGIDEILAALRRALVDQDDSIRPLS